MQQQPAPLYTPIAFILTQTIGLDANPNPPTSTQPIHSIPSEHKYKDILIPVSVGSVDLLYLYYMYHVPPVYNWLRGMTVVGGLGGGYERDRLAEYIAGGFPSKQDNSKASSSSRNYLPSFNPRTILTNLLKLTPKYPILKKCLPTHIQILKPTSSINLHQVCKHNIKLSVSTSNYVYNKEKSRLEVKSYYCKECQKDIEVCGDRGHYQVEDYPLAPFFEGFYGEKIEVNFSRADQKPKFLSFRVCQIYTDGKVYILAANGLWYRGDIRDDQHMERGVRLGDMKVCGEIGKVFNEAAGKKWKGLCVYVREEMITDCGVLKLAASLCGKQGKIRRQDKSKQKTSHQPAPKAFSLPKQQRQRQKQTKIQQREHKKSTRKLQLQQAKPEMQEQQEQLQPLPTTKYNPSTTILLAQNLAKQTATKYKQEVNKLYAHEKQKDEYEKDYDKGKTKKIKKKVEYIRPDFNEIFNTVKKDNEELIAGLRMPDKKNRRMFRKEKTPQDPNAQQPDGQEKGKDQEGRGNFRDRGRGGRGGFRGGRGRGRGGKFGNRGGRKQYKQRKRQQKQKFTQKFQSA